MMSSESSSQSHLLIQLAEETYAIHVSKVYQIFEVPPVTKVPQTPPYMLGVMNARGRMLPVIDLRILYGIETSGHSKHTAIIATSCNFDDGAETQSQEVGLLVDAVHEVADIDYTQIERPTLPGSSGSYSCFSGFVRFNNKIVMMLDVDHLLNTENITQIKSYVSEDTPV